MTSQIVTEIQSISLLNTLFGLGYNNATSCMHMTSYWNGLHYWNKSDYSFVL